MLRASGVTVKRGGGARSDRRRAGSRDAMRAASALLTTAMPARGAICAQPLLALANLGVQ